MTHVSTFGHKLLEGEIATFLVFIIVLVMVMEHPHLLLVMTTTAHGATQHHFIPVLLT